MAGELYGRLEVIQTELSDVRRARNRKGMG